MKSSAQAPGARAEREGAGVDRNNLCAAGERRPEIEEENASRSAWSWIRTSPRCSRADGSSVSRMARRSSSRLAESCSTVPHLLSNLNHAKDYEHDSRADEN